MLFSTEIYQAVKSMSEPTKSEKNSVFSFASSNSLILTSLSGSWFLVASRASLLVASSSYLV